MTISVRGVIFGSRLPRYGVNFARRFTLDSAFLEETPDQRPLQHPNIRGQGYYH